MTAHGHLQSRASILLSHRSFLHDCIVGWTCFFVECANVAGSAGVPMWGGPCWAISSSNGRPVTRQPMADAIVVP
jgi:hypothetical protein